MVSGVIQALGMGILRPGPAPSQIGAPLSPAPSLPSQKNPSSSTKPAVEEPRRIFWLGPSARARELTENQLS